MAKFQNKPQMIDGRSEKKLALEGCLTVHLPHEII
jgi:hypothetical protein